ncbi:MAG: alanine--tRNA ligase [Patescibacteria group bacterium]
MRTTEEIRKLYLEFFKSKGHTIIPSASLIPENDPSVLFTTAGMHPLVPYLLGEPHPGGNKITSCQKCIRTGDIDEVGDATHLTFFEMLGNWSLGNVYWKKEAIEMSFEFLTSKQWLGLNKEKIAVSVFQGDEDAPFDQEAFDIWKSMGISEKRIAKLPKKNNWWGPAGETGPCGPDTEMFYWTGNPNEVPESFNDDNVLWVEIWNDVFMQYNKTRDGIYEPLKQKNVDTGMGLERTVAVLNNCDVYLIDTFKPIIKRIEKLSGKKYGSDENITRSIRIIADHVRAAVFISGDERGIIPSNVGQGYVLRKLVRRTVRYGKKIGIEKKFIKEITEEVIQIFKHVYPEFEKNKGRITEEMEKEEEKFAIALEKGLREFEKLSSIDGKIAFDLYQSYGFPIELTEELSKEKGLEINKKEFENEFKKHQELSRTASAGAFKGGLADHSEEVIKYHTATHLLHKALREVLGEHVEQRGSNLTAERLRFDFSHQAKMTPEELLRVEKIVNEKIQEDFPVRFEMLTVEEAKKRGAIGLFENKYATLGEKVKVYSIGDYSTEICGGPHVEHTGQIGKFKITKEEAVAAGIRRIKAVVT